MRERLHHEDSKTRRASGAPRPLGEELIRLDRSTRKAALAFGLTALSLWLAALAFGSIGSLFILPLVACLLAVFAWLARLYRRRELVRRRALACWDVVEAPSLIDAARRGSRDSRRVACGTLARILPLFRERNAELLVRRHLDWMHRQLARSALHADRSDLVERPSEDLILAVFQALRYVGTADSGRYVRNLTSAYQSVQVRAAAEACLPDLEARVARLRNTQTLLRPAAAPDSAESLLRPACAGQPDSDGLTLLRPADPGAANSYARAHCMYNQPARNEGGMERP